MKNTLFCLLTLVLFVLNAAAQQNESFKLSTDKPETGKKIHFVYTGIFSKKLDPRITLYYDKNGRSTWMTLKAKYTGSLTEGSFILPDSILAFSIKPRNHRDSSENFVFQVYKDGKALKGSFAAAAKHYGNWGLVEPIVFQKALSLYRHEFELHPDLKPDFLLDYFFLTAQRPDAQATEEMARTWQDSLQHGKNEQFLNRLYPTALRYKDLWNKDRLKAQLLAKYPNGTMAFQEAAGYIDNKMEKQNFPAVLQSLENKFPQPRKSGEFDRIYQRYGNQLIEKGLLSVYDSYVFKIQAPAIKRELYASGARILVKNGNHLEQAEFYIQQALLLLDFGVANKSFHVIDKSFWFENKKGLRGNYLDILAQIKHRLGNTAKAVKHLEEALTLNDYNNDIRIHYLQYLLAMQQYKTALKAATGFVNKDRETKEIKNFLVESYGKVNGSSDGAEVYYDRLITARDRKYKVPKYSMLNVKSIDFTLNDLNGVPFSLSDYNGKSVVLYFFSAYSYDEQELAKHKYFDQLAIKYNGDKNMVFVAIDKTPPVPIDEATQNKLRLEKVQAFMKTNDFQYRVLLDDYHYNATNSGLTYFRVADDYSADGTSQFYMIDKKGIVRYKSYIIPGGFDKFSRDFSKALKIID